MNEMVSKTNSGAPERRIGWVGKREWYLVGVYTVLVSFSDQYLYVNINREDGDDENERFAAELNAHFSSNYPTSSSMDTSFLKIPHAFLNECLEFVTIFGGCSNLGMEVTSSVSS